MIVDVVPSQAIDFKFFAPLTKKLFNSYVLIPRCGPICVHPFWAHRGNGSIKLLREKRIDSFVQWCNYCTSLPMIHGLDPFPTVTVGPPWGKKIGIGGFRMGKITWKYEEIIFNNKRNKTKKNQLLGTTLTKRFQCLIHMYVQQFPCNRAFSVGRFYWEKL